MRYPDLEQVQEAFSASAAPPTGRFRLPARRQRRITTLDETGRAGIRAVTTGRFRFMEMARELQGAAGLDELQEELRQAGERALVKLSLAGFLPEEAYISRRRWFDEVRQGLLYLEEDDSDLAVEISAELIETHFPAGSLPHRLLSRLAQKNDPAALQLAYRLIDEVKR